MRFYELHNLYYIIIVPIVFVIFLIAKRRRVKTVEGMGNAGTLDRFSTQKIGGRILTQGAIVSAALLFFILALSRPQAGTRLEPVQITASDLYIAIDLSRSMTVEDVKPNRLERAKLSALEIVNSLRGDRIGLILFAGDAFVQCPLTNDYEAVSTFISSLGTKTAEASGTSLGAPLEVALRSLEATDDRYALIVLLTDGENNSGDPGKVIKEVKKRGIKVFCIGIGTGEGAPIPVYDETGKRTGYKKDPTGQVVISRLRNDLLRTISRETYGYYYKAGRTVDEAKKVTAAVRAMKKRDLELKRFTVYEDRFQIPLGVGIGLLLLYISILVKKNGKRL
ncbi:MAG TPA: VWA domain-containing protein [Spirochaetota bacterium]|nr:VWA domain-containing protein [Spirochaetota bacterium]